MKKLIILLVLIFIFSSVSVSAALIDDIISYWKFDEISGTVVDSAGTSGGANNGAIRGVTGIIDKSFYFNGSNNDVIVAGPIVWGENSGTNATISIWFNVTNGTTNQYFFDSNISGSASSIVGTTNVTNGIFNHVVLTTAGSNFTMYVNGTVEASTIMVPNSGVIVGIQIFLNNGVLNVFSRATSNQDNFIFGEEHENCGSTSTTCRLDGQLDEIGYWNRTLSSAEITSLFNEGIGITYPFSIVQLNEPINNATTLNNTLLFNVTAIPIANSVNLVNSTLEIYHLNNSLLNQTTNIITGNTTNQTTFNITGIPLGRFRWNAFICSLRIDDSSTECSYAANNFSFDNGYLFNGVDFNSDVSELSSQEFIFNITLVSGLVSSDGTFIYNTSSTPSTATDSGDETLYSTTISSPSLNNAQNVSFNFELDLNDGVNSQIFNISFNGQTVSPLGLDNCSTSTLLILNYTLRDEESRDVFNAGDNTTEEIEVLLTSLIDANSNTTFSASYNNTNPAQVCIEASALNESAFRMDVITQYSAQNHETEFHNIQNFTLRNTTIPQNIDLHDLLTTDSQEFVITFKDENFLPVDNALIDITRKYIADGLFRSVEIPKTDTEGETIGHFVLSDVIYTLIVSKNGVTLGTFDNVIAVCDDQSIGDCKINLQAFGAGISPEHFQSAAGLQYTLTFDRATRTITSIFTTNDGSSATVALNATLFDRFGNNTLCSDQLTSSAGTLTCLVPQSIGNVTVVAELTKNGVFVAQTTFSLLESAADLFGGTRIILLLILYITIPLMGITSGVAVVVLAFVGLIFAGLLNLYEGGSLFGVGSAILWFIIAGGIIIWKIHQRST